MAQEENGTTCWTHSRKAKPLKLIRELGPLEGSLLAQKHALELCTSFTPAPPPPQPLWSQITLAAEDLLGAPKRLVSGDEQPGGGGEERKVAVLSQTKWVGPKAQRCQICVGSNTLISIIHTHKTYYIYE